jgi:uncharacterized cupredoxin-like copper-binding protein
MIPKAIRAVAVGVIAPLALAACRGETTGTEESPRTVEIQALDELRFEPSEVTVQAGETVRFVVTNPGEILHEFVLGPEHVQMAHEEASEAGEEHGGMHVEGQLAALDVDPESTEEVTVTFEEGGEMLFGCHEPGHYQGGMVGTVIIEG